MILGIFANPAVPPDIPPFGTQNELFANIIEQACEAKMTVYVFMPNDVPKKINSMWYGRIALDNGEWIRQKFPPPQAIYDRGLFAATPLAKDAKRVRKLLTKHHFKFLSDLDFPKFTRDKWKFFQYCSKHKRLKTFIPETILLDEIFLKHKKFFTKNNSFVIKPRYGQKGAGVVLFNKTRNGYSYDYREKTKKGIIPRKGLLRDLKYLPDFASKLPYNYKDYIIQKTVDSMKFRNRYFDIRIIFQKQNIKKPCKIIGIGVRVAPPKAIAANLSLGGDAFRLSKVIPGQSITKRLHNLGNTLCSVITKYFSVNEFAADVMIDRNKRLWLIEINSKPDYGIFKRIGYDRLRKETVKNICLYARSVL